MCVGLLDESTSTEAPATAAMAVIGRARVWLYSATW